MGLAAVVLTAFLLSSQRRPQTTAPPNDQLFELQYLVLAASLFGSLLITGMTLNLQTPLLELVLLWWSVLVGASSLPS